jgi:glycosyltransferase involved in cell wall biosynthesis
MPLGIRQGGAEGLLHHLLEHRRSRHTYICAFLQPGPLVEEVRALGFATAVFPTGQLRDVSNYIVTVRALRAWMRLHRLDAVLSWMAKAHLYVSPAAIFTGIPVLWYQHGTPRGELWDRAVTLLPASKILCCSETSRLAQDSLFPPRDTVVCYPGVELSTRRITRPFARKSLGLPATSPVIGMVARLERWKGIHIFVEFARLLATRFPDAIFFVVGGTHPRDLAYAREIDEQVGKANLGDRLLLVGQRTPDEVALWQAAADIVVHPTTGTEPFGMAVVEAMGAGTPVIASDMAGPSEIITNGLNGFLVTPDDAQAVADAATRLLTDPELMSSMAAEALDRSSRFSLEAFQLRIDDILSELADA